MRALVLILPFVVGCLDSSKGSVARVAPGECEHVAELKTVSYDVESAAIGRCGVVGYWSGFSGQHARGFVLLGSDGAERARVDQPNGYGGQVAMAPDGAAVAWWQLESDLGFGHAWVAPLDGVVAAATRSLDGGALVVGADFAVMGDQGVLARFDLVTGAADAIGDYVDYEPMVVSGDGQRVVVGGDTTRVFDRDGALLLSGVGWHDVVVGQTVVAASTPDGVVWVDTRGDVHEGAGTRVLAVVGERVWVARDGRVVDATTMDEIPTIGIPSIVAAGADGFAFVAGDQLGVWTEDGMLSLGTIDSEVTALALLDDAVLFAARGGPGEELFIVDRQTKKRGLLRGGHEFQMTVDQTGEAVAISYTPQSGVYTALDVGHPVMPSSSSALGD